METRRTDFCAHSENRGSLVLALRLTLLLSFTVTVCRGADRDDARPIVPSDRPVPKFNRDVRPILTEHCLQCHGQDSVHREASLRLDDENDVTRLRDGYRIIDRQRPRSGEMWRRIQSDDPDELMPPPESGHALDLRQKEILLSWLSAGAPWQKHWSFTVPENVSVPGLENDDWSRNPVDRFILQRMNAASLEPAGVAPRETLIRRITFDLTGLPPTPDEVADYVADVRPGAYERVVDRLLASPRYGEHMALSWLDLARYADTDGYQNDGPRTMYRWRDWVIAACNANQPFDQFTIEQLAGDLLPNPTLDQRIATGFNRNHRYNSEAGLVLEEFLFENAVDRVDTTATVWMGLTLGCARCHDHKYDPLSQRDYYGMLAFFDQVAESGRAVKFGNSEPVIRAPTNSQRLALAARDAEIQRLRKQFKELQRRLDVEVERRFGAQNPTDVERPMIADGLAARFPLDRLPKDAGLKLVPGLFGRAVQCDGISSVGTSSAGRMRCESRFSVSFWINAVNADDGVILSRQDRNTRRPGLAVELNDGRLQFAIVTRWVAGVAAVETTTRIPVEDWVHVTVTNDGSQSARGMQIFLNGKLQKTRILHNTNSNTGGVSAQSQLRIGRGVVGNGFRGRVDELRIYDRTLWPDEIELLSCRSTVDAIRRIPRAGRTTLQQSVLRRWALEYLPDVPGAAIWKRLMAARRARLKFLDGLPTAMVMSDVVRRRPTHLRVRGVYDALGDVIGPATPAVLQMPDTADSKTRLEMAAWLVSPGHPLTARVAINRYWQHFFGAGLVETPEDFGVRGKLPTHPDLLDWLAREFEDSGWDVKHVQRMLVTSATYRQAAVVQKPVILADPSNRLHTRRNRQRLSAHAIRDQALHLSGLLTERLGGASVKPYQPSGFWSEMSNMRYVQAVGDDLYRRSLYTFWKRTVAPPVLAVLDAADRENCTVRKDRTNTPLQALATLNDVTYVEAARGLAQRILRRNGDTVADMFEMVLMRQPSDSERLVLEMAYADFCDRFQKDAIAADHLLSVGESRVAKDLDPTELAAATLLANLILNLDEAITIE